MPKPKGTGFIPCTNCGGTRATDRTETSVDNNGRQKVTKVRVICPTCNGRGGHHV